MKYSKLSVILLFTYLMAGCSSEELKRVSYQSQINGEERDFFLYLPRGYESSDKNWPVLMFLHGNGERGNGKEDLDYVMIHGPLMEAWVQKRDLPFIIITPQLHMFDMDKEADYLANRDPSSIPKRQEKGVPDRMAASRPDFSMDGMASEMPRYITLPRGWDMVQDDLLNMVDTVLREYRADSERVYLTGLSYGGFGTWYMAGHHPERFTAIAPVAGWGHPSLMDSIAAHDIPVWTFAGGRDPVVPLKYFYPGMNRLEEAGHSSVRFTVHEDMGHDVWKRVYEGEDLYQWLLKQK